MKEKERATREELLMMWLQLKHIAETVSNQEPYKGRSWRLKCSWDEEKAGPDFCLWLGDSSIDIDAPRFYNEEVPEPEQPREVDVP